VLDFLRFVVVYLTNSRASENELSLGTVTKLIDAALPSSQSPFLVGLLLKLAGNNIVNED
jgi:hypothetical protein